LFKTLLRYMKNTFILAVLLFSLKTSMAQDNKSFAEKEGVLFFGPSFTNIKNSNISSDKYASSKGSVWFNLGFNFYKYSNKNMGFILGLEYAKYKNVTAYKGAFRSEIRSIDIDGDPYYAVSEANYTDTRIVNSVDVPLGIRLTSPVGEHAALFVDFGLNVNLILNAKIEQKGTLDKKGAYITNYDNVFVYLEEAPYYGYTNTTYNSEIELPVNRINAGYFLGVGVKARLNENFFIVINPTYTNGINDINKKDGTSDYENVFGEKTAHKKFTLTQFVMRIGLGFEM
jgi:hypothetical protein